MMGDARLGELVRSLIEQRVGHLWTAVLGRIEKIDHKKCRAEVRPLVKLPVGQNKWADPGVIYEVPIDIARAGPFYVRRPYQQGDIVLLIVATHSLENQIYDHQPREVPYGHRHMLHDAILIGGFRADTDPTYPERWRDDLLIQNSETGDTIVLYHDGGMDVYLPGAKNGRSLALDAAEEVRIRTYRNKITLDGSTKIELGLRPEYRVLLGEKVIETFNAHIHTGVQTGDGTTGPPVQRMDDGHLSQLAYVRAKPPGVRPFPEIETLAQFAGGASLISVGDFSGWFVGVGEQGGVGGLFGIVGAVLGAIGQLIGGAVGGFLNFMGGLAEWIGEEGVQLLLNALGEAIQENWVQLLTLALTNPPAAVALLAEKTAENLFEDVADEVVEEFFNALGKWLIDQGLDAVGEYVAQIDGIDDLGEFLGGLGQVAQSVQSGDWDAIVRELVNWANENYGDAGLEGVVAVVIGALLKNTQEETEGGEE